MSLNLEWENFINSTGDEHKTILTKEENDFIPSVNDLYISTQTKIAYLNQQIELNNIFWKIEVIPYQDRKCGVIKKQMKVNCLNPEEVVELEKNIEMIKGIKQIDTISNIKKVHGDAVIFKDVRKINVGISRKDLTTYRIKKKGAFYNCFVLIIRIEIAQDRYKEFHVKIFNTGKLELPGIQSNELLYKVLDMLKLILSPFITDIDYNDDVETVLINSNFKCNYYINRDKLVDLLKFKYNLHIVYDPCSYPGIQCKFYYNINYKNNMGSCVCETRCYKDKTKNPNKCSELSFMVFRTGSILIVGKCNEDVLYYIYNFIKNILLTDYEEFMIMAPEDAKKPKKKKVWKKTILSTKL
jgi:hypothetical protein